MKNKKKDKDKVYNEKDENLNELDDVESDAESADDLEEDAPEDIDPENEEDESEDNQEESGAADDSLSDDGDKDRDEDELTDDQEDSDEYEDVSDLSEESDESDDDMGAVVEGKSENVAPKKVRLYEDYVIDDPEDMDEAPDTGDMFDDDYDIDMPVRSRRRNRKSDRIYGPSGKVLTWLWGLFVVLLCAYIYVFHINTTIFADDITGRDNSVNIEVPAGANYSLCTIDEINQLVSNYLLARTNADQTTLQRLVTDPSEFDDMSSIKIAAQYITAYNRTTCYMVPGKTADAYIIYALSNLTIKDVNSEPLDIRSFYVVKQTDGSYKIDNSQLSDDENKYIQEVTASKYIQDMYQYVKENTDYLLKHDDTFKKFQNMYN